MPFFLVSLAGVWVLVFVVLKHYEKQLNAAPPDSQLRLIQSGTPTPNGLPIYWDAPDFSMTDQNGAKVSLADLRGRPWVCDFIFTHCAASCPMMSTIMSRLQKPLNGTSVRLISFSVDPQQDTQQVLSDYAKNYDADAARWSFLRADDKQAAYNVAVGMKIVAQPQHDDNPILHSDRFLLVDAQGRLRGIYNSADADAMRKLVTDARQLASESPAPAIDSAPTTQPARGDLMVDARPATTQPGATTVQDVVCQMPVSITDKTLHELYKGKTYYFCSDNCRNKFLAHPKLYAKP